MSFNDPLVIGSYQPQPVRALKEIIPRSVPPITLRGAPQYNQALDQELQKMLTKQQSPERAMRNVERRWNQITKRLGTERQARAIRESYAAFPPKGRYGPSKRIA
jgi:ferric-dicitrate binding protein FerR (iron transport regulator)